MTLDRERTIPKDCVMELSDDELRVLMPEHASSQPNEDAYMVRAEGLTPAPIEGQRVIAIRPDGLEDVEVSVPHLPYEYWITDAGNVVSVPIRTNRVRKGNVSIDNSTYKDMMVNACYRRGWLKFHSGAYGEDKKAWLARRSKVIAERQKRQRLKTEQAEAELREKDRQQGLKLQEAVAKAFETLADGDNDRARRAKHRDALKKGR